MKTRLAFIIFPMLLLSSCVAYEEYLADNGNGATVRERAFGRMGGTRSTHRADGSSAVDDYQVSFRDGTTAALGIAGAVANVRNTSSNNSLNATKAKANTTPTVTTPTVDPATGAVLTPVVTFPPQQ